MGYRGQSGDRGVTGERGVKGDHGQDGETGPTGDVGPAGPIGRTGPTSPYLGRRQTLVIFAFVALAFVLLAYRTETNSSNSDRGLYEGCMHRVEFHGAAADCERFR